MNNLKVTKIDGTELHFKNAEYYITYYNKSYVFFEYDNGEIVSSVCLNKSEIKSIDND